ncbi:MAG: phosphate acyltransferase PlsX [Eubacteriales bacterium]|nr:phosphate acyltransferase PlsX [Eubacteriales bacterium]
MIKIGIDTFGGDAGALNPILAAISYINENKDDNLYLYLYGDEKQISEEIEKSLDKKYINNIQIINTNDFIDLNKDVLSEFKRHTTSMSLGMKDLQDDKIDAFISQGSSAAIRIFANFVGRIKGIKECPFGALVPTMNKNTLLLDSGANVDIRPEDLQQFALLGSVYMKTLYNIQNPSVALLNNGLEEEKGNKQTKQAYQLLKNDKRINFYGNLEFRDFPKGLVDIVVCDGFVGNCILKTYEGTSKELIKLLKSIFLKNIKTMIAALLIKNELKEILKNYSTENFGGAPILGCKKVIIKCHGNSKEKELYNAINQAKDYIEKDITGKIISTYN